MKLIGDLVLVTTDESEATDKRSAGGIIIPDDVRELETPATVVAVGDGHLTINGKHPLTVQAGDKILYRKGAGPKLKIEGNHYIMIRESDIFAIL